jgi:hypothetical protein
MLDWGKDMRQSETGSYYLSRREDILDLYDTHSRAWRPLLARRYGDTLAEEIIQDAREVLEGLIRELPYIGGDDNPMTRHLLRSTTSLVLYKVMKARGKTPEEVGKIIYDAVAHAVSQLPAHPFKELSAEDMAQEREQARKSQERRYPGDWVWEFVEGDGEEFDFGYDFLECGTQKLYHAHDADEFLPFYCYLDFVTQRTSGWGFARSMTLGEGYDKCDFRWKKGGETRKGWPPPFLEQEGN